ncbi:MAG: thioesterase family protein [bacterium]|nr:thioesterase family protein [bacterium]
MRDTLRVGMTHTLRLTVPERLTVPGLMPEVESWQVMPKVLATSMLVALMEWSALEVLLPHYEEGEQSVGVHIDMSHVAATPPGMAVEVAATLVQIDGRFYDFEILARDELDVIGEAKHRRAAVMRAKFDERLAQKIARSQGA